jgi:hypothetical protein
MNKKGEHKVFLREDGIIYVEMSGDLDRDNALATINEAADFAKSTPHKAKILVTIYASSSFGGSQRRKELVNILKEVYKDPGFEKIAVFGFNPVVRTIVSFVVMATQIKTIKLFSNTESALKWLNKSD